MKSGIERSGWGVRLVAGLLAGGALVYVDNFAFDGEASPIVIVAMLWAFTAIAGACWGRRSLLVSLVVWACVPGAHVVKHVLGLPDTLQPNTYTSIGYLAVFSLVVALVGTSMGMIMHGATKRTLRRDSGSA